MIHYFEDIRLWFTSPSGGEPLSLTVGSLPVPLRPKGVPEDTILLGLKDGQEFAFSFSINGDQEYAVLPSIKGINPLTGLEAEQELRAHFRGTHCPKDPSHGVLGKNGWCPVCSHHWPDRNFLRVYRNNSLTGWRTGLNEVRPFIASSDMEKDVASFLQGGYSPSAAIGLSIYKGGVIKENNNRYPWTYWLNSGTVVRSSWPTFDSNNALLTCSNGRGRFSSSTACYTSSVSNDSPPMAEALADIKEMAVGAGEARTQADDSMKDYDWWRGTWLEHTFDMDNYSEKQVHTFSIVPVPLSYLQGLVTEKAAKVHEGTFKGIPTMGK